MKSKGLNLLSASLKLDHYISAFIPNNIMYICFINKVNNLIHLLRLIRMFQSCKKTVLINIYQEPSYRFDRLIRKDIKYIGCKQNRHGMKKIKQRKSEIK